MNYTRPQNFMIVYAETMVEPYSIRTRYASRKCAENAAKRMNVRRIASGHAKGNTYAVYSLDEYAAAVKGKGEWRTSVVGGGKVWVPLGTPACCDPSTETYWSM
jgi:hypothetical protein